MIILNVRVSGVLRMAMGGRFGGSGYGGGSRSPSDLRVRPQTLTWEVKTFI